MRTVRKEYPPPNITDAAIENLLKYDGITEENSLFDQSPRALLKQFWASNLRNLIEGKIIKVVDGHFLINRIIAVVAPFTEQVPVFVLYVELNNNRSEKIVITAGELEVSLPCLADMDWRSSVHVGNLYQTLQDLGPIIQYEETLRKISHKN